MAERTYTQADLNAAVEAALGDALWEAKTPVPSGNGSYQLGFLNGQAASQDAIEKLLPTAGQALAKREAEVRLEEAIEWAARLALVNAKLLSLPGINSYPHIADWAAKRIAELRAATQPTAIDVGNLATESRCSPHKPDRE